MTIFKSTGVFKDLNVLKVDSRGRVRFASQGLRFDVTVNGVNVYDRSRYKNRESSVFKELSQIKPKTFRMITEAFDLLGAV